MPDIYHALADPTRRAILDELSERDHQTLFELCARLSSRHGVSSSRQAISQHLGVLESVGLIAVERSGRYKFHSIDTTPLDEVRERWRPAKGDDRLRINITSVFVDDQTKALRFYTEVLGFRKKADVPVDADRWLTVVSPEAPDGPELFLEPAGHPAVGPFREALAADGIPATSFAVDDVDAEWRRLTALGVKFTQEPMDVGEVAMAVFDDTCGNLIQITGPVL